MNDLIISIFVSIIFLIILSIFSGFMKFLFDMINIIRNEKVKKEKLNPFEIYKERKGFFLKNILLGYLDFIVIIVALPYFAFYYLTGKSYSDIRNEDIDNISKNLIKKRKIKETKKKIENF